MSQLCSRPFDAILVVVALLAYASPCAQAHEVKHKTISLKHPWVRAMPRGATETAGYVEITNKGAKPDKLVEAGLESAASAELHVSVVEDGVARMRRIEDGIVIPPGETVTLASGGSHIMFSGLKRPLEADEYVDGSLTFEKAGRMTIEYYVEPIAGSEDAAPDGPGDSTGHDRH